MLCRSRFQLRLAAPRVVGEPEDAGGFEMALSLTQCDASDTATRRKARVVVVCELEVDVLQTITVA